MNFDFWSVIIVVFIFQGVFLLSSILIPKKRRAREENMYMSFMIIALLWYLFEFLAVRNTFDFGFTLFYGTRYGSWLLFGPLAYFYFCAITKVGWKLRKSDLLHFLPFFIFVLLIPVTFGEVLNSRQVDYGMLSVFDHREKIITPLQYVYSFVFILQFAHLTFYIYKNTQLLKNYTTSLRNEFSNITGNIKWLKLFNGSFLIIVLAAAIFLYLLLVTDIYRRHLDYIYVLPMGSLFYIVSYYLINANWEPAIKEPVPKYAKSSFDSGNISEYIEKLNQLMGIEKVYLDKELRLTDLAEKMGLTAHHLSQLLNQHFSLSFFDFVNKYRIDEAKEMIKNNPEYTLLQVAFDSGFNNKTSFVNAFKKFESTTPSSYRGKEIAA